MTPKHPCCSRPQDNTRAVMAAIKRFHLLQQGRLKDEQREPALAGWLALSAEDIGAARAVLSPRAVRACCVVRILRFLVLSIGFWAGVQGLRGLPSAAFLGGAALVGIFGMFAAEFIKLGTTALRDDIRPASAMPDRCAAALHTLQYDDARAHRDAVLGRGRELTWLDLEYMQACARGRERERSLDAQREACRQLHGLENPEPVSDAG